MKTAGVILAAGEGTRMRSGQPKVMHELCGEPLIFYPVSLALRRGYRPVVVVLGRRGDAVRTFLSGRFGSRVFFARQDPPAGTGHAVLAAQGSLRRFSGQVVILYGDVPLLTSADLAALERAGRDAALAFLTCRREDPAGYGRVVRDDRGRAARIVEQSDANAAERRIVEINAGIYLCRAPFVFQALRGIRRANAQGEYYLTDLVEVACKRKLIVSAVLRKNSRGLLGINDRRELAEAESLMNLLLAEKLMSSGVTVVDPARTRLGPGVRAGRDTVILPDCQIQGRVSIGAGCRIGPGVLIRDARIGPGAEIRAYSVLEESVLGREAVVGPFARLRPGTVLAAGARVGNFVEAKKTRLGKDSKANHLTYLGDAVIGDGVNVGAGTITCNYDGFKKYPTVIEDGVFIGSDTQLVAPVRVGRGAVVGAGTTVTADVPPGALAVSRVRQQNIPGYAGRSRRRKRS